MKRRVAVISGGRQCGKSTLAEAMIGARKTSMILCGHESERQLSEMEIPEIILVEISSFTKPHDIARIDRCLGKRPDYVFTVDKLEGNGFDLWTGLESNEDFIVTQIEMK